MNYYIVKVIKYFSEIRKCYRDFWNGLRGISRPSQMKTYTSAFEYWVENIIVIYDEMEKVINEDDDSSKKKEIEESEDEDDGIQLKELKDVYPILNSQHNS